MNATLIAGLLGTLLGGMLSVGGQLLTARQKRSHDLLAKQREERRTVYSGFLATIIDLEKILEDAHGRNRNKESITKIGPAMALVGQQWNLIALSTESKETFLAGDALHKAVLRPLGMPDSSGGKSLNALIIEFIKAARKELGSSALPKGLREIREDKVNLWIPVVEPKATQP